MENRLGVEVEGEEDEGSCLRLRVKLSRVESSQGRIESGSRIEDCMGVYFEGSVWISSGISIIDLMDALA